MQLTNTRTHPPTYYRDIIVFEKRRFGKAGVHKFFRFEECFREGPCRDDLVWTEGPRIETKLRFQIPLD